MRIYQEVKGLDESIATNKAMAARSSDLGPAMRAVLAEMYEIERDLFNSEGESGEHGRWADIQYESRSKRRADPNGKILHDTGALENSLTRGNALGSRRIITKSSVTIGSNIPYASFQGERRPIDFTARQVEYLNELVQLYVEGRIHL